MRAVKIIVCGGHFSPALAVMEKLQQRKKYKIFYIGSKNVLEGDRVESLEYLTLKKLRISFYSLICARLQRSFTLFTIPSLAKLPLSFFQSLYLLLKVKPDVVMSFGGYVALSVSLTAYLLKIPIITHEQTHVLGLTNRIISRFAKVMCLSWQNTKNVPIATKIVLTGNPIRTSIISPKKSKLVNFGNKDLPLVYITGGSLGSQSINKVIRQTLPFFASHFRIIHQCGSAEGGKDYFFLLKRRNSLPRSVQKNYRLTKHIDSADIGGVIHESLFIVGRSGANTVAEITILGKPAIFIPLPWAADNEQEQNARVLVGRGSAIIIKQEDFTNGKFKETLQEITKNISQYQRKAQKNKELIPLDAADRIVDVIESYLPR